MYRRLYYILITVAASLCLTAFLTACDGSSSGSAEDIGRGSTKPVVMIYHAEDLMAVRMDVEGNYALGADIELTDRWTPVGTRSQPFTGTFNGNGFTVKGLEAGGRDSDYIGLFGYVSGAYITSLRIELGAAGLEGNNYVGGVAGYAIGSRISLCSVTGVISSKNEAGGIAGFISRSIISAVHSEGSVSVRGSGGGIAGQIVDGSTLLNSYSTMAVSGENYLGGLTGRLHSSTAVNNYASGLISNINTVSERIGGLFGKAENSEFENNVALNERVLGQRYIGRIAGEAINCVTGDNYAVNMGILENTGLAGIEITHEASLNESTYKAIGWKFGNEINAPWTAATPYPVLYFIK